MQLNVFLILFLVIITYRACGLKNLMKPSFIPYCTTRDKCQPACSCEILPKCEVLPLDNITRDSILFYHNQIRDIQSRAEPQPGGMAMLKYDEQLEEVSRCWAARCEDEYSECFMSSLYPEISMSVTQIQLDDGETPNNILWIKILNYWLGNTKYLSVETLSSMPAGERGENLRNYAQIMSDRILSVGCAWSKSDVFLTCVCSYGPRGPLQGEPIYRAGTPCSLCPLNYACDYKKPFENLCKEVGHSTVSPVDTPPSPPPIPPSKSYEIMRAQNYPPRLRYDKFQVSSESSNEKSEPMELEYEPQRSPDIEVVQEYPLKQDHLPSSYYSEEKPDQNYQDNSATPPHPPEVPSQYVTPPMLPLIPSGEPPPLFVQSPDESFSVPPPPPLPHSPPSPDYMNEDISSEYLLSSTNPNVPTDSLVSPQTIPQYPNPPEIRINPSPPNVPVRGKGGNMENDSKEKRSSGHHRRSYSARTKLTNTIIYISLFISLFDK